LKNDSLTRISGVMFYCLWIWTRLWEFSPASYNDVRKKCLLYAYFPCIT